MVAEGCHQKNGIVGHQVMIVCLGIKSVVVPHSLIPQRLGSDIPQPVRVVIVITPGKANIGVCSSDHCQSNLFVENDDSILRYLYPT